MSTPTQWISALIVAAGLSLTAACASAPTTPPSTPTPVVTRPPTTATTAAPSPTSTSLPATATSQSSATPRTTTTPTPDKRLVRLLENGAPALSVAFAPNGKGLASVSGKTLRLWQLGDGQLAREMTQDAEAKSVAFAPDGIRLLASDGTQATLWQVSDGQRLNALAHSDPVYIVAFAPDGTLIATVDGPTVNLWAASDGTFLRALAHTEPVQALAFAPDGATVAAANGTAVSLWNVNDGEFIADLTHTDPVLSVAFAPDGEHLAAANGPNISLWQVAERAATQELTAKAKVVSVAFAARGGLLASGADDNTVALWRVSDGQLLETRSGHTQPALSLAFAPDGLTLASGSADGTIRVWDTSSASLPVFPTPKPTATSKATATPGLTPAKVIQLDSTAKWPPRLAFSPDNQRLAGGSRSPFAYVWDVNSGAVIFQLAHGPEGGKVEDVVFAPDGSWLATSSEAEGTVKLWNMGDGSLIRTLSPEGGKVHHIAIAPSGGLIAATNDAGVWLYQTGDGALVNKFGQAALYEADFSANGQYLVVTYENIFEVWNVADGTLASFNEGRPWGDAGIGFLNAAIFVGNTGVLAGFEGEEARLWDIRFSGSGYNSTRHTQGVNDVAIHPTGFISGSSDGTARLARTGQPDLIFPAQTWVASVATSPDGQWLATGEEGLIELWALPR